MKKEVERLLNTCNKLINSLNDIGLTPSQYKAIEEFREELGKTLLELNNL